MLMSTPIARAYVFAAGILAMLGVSLGVNAQTRDATGWPTVNLNLRQGPGTEYPKTTVLQKSTQVKIAGCTSDGAWCAVQDSNGNAGFASARYLTGFDPGNQPVIGSGNGFVDGFSPNMPVTLAGVDPLSGSPQNQLWGDYYFMFEGGVCGGGGAPLFTGAQTTGGGTRTVNTNGRSGNAAGCFGAGFGTTFGPPGRQTRIGGDFYFINTSDSQTVRFQRDTFTPGPWDSVVTLDQGNTVSAGVNIDQELGSFACGDNGSPCTFGVTGGAGLTYQETTLRSSFDQSCCGGGVTTLERNDTGVDPYLQGGGFVSIPVQGSIVDLIFAGRWSPDRTLSMAGTDSFGQPITDKVTIPGETRVMLTTRIRVPVRNVFPGGSRPDNVLLAAGGGPANGVLRDSRDAIISTTTCGANATISFYQLSLQLDGRRYDQTGWGRAHLRYAGNPGAPLQYLNLIVNDNQVALNLPLRPGETTGQSIDLMLWIGLGVDDGTAVNRLTYDCSVSPNRLIGAPQGDEKDAEVEDAEIKVWSDFWKQTLTYQGPQSEKDRTWYPSTEFDVVDSAFHPWHMIDRSNQECGKQECFPAAISNSFKMMLRLHPEKLKHLSDDPDRDDDDTDIKTFKNGTWTGWFDTFVSGGGSQTGRTGDPEAGFNRFKSKLEREENTRYPFKPEIIDDPKDLDRVLRTVKEKGDCKLLGNAHAMLVTGVIKLKNGDYLFEIADDSAQGEPGGTDVRLVKYDAAANKFSGYILGGRSMTKGEGTVGGNVIFVCETVK